MNALRSQFLTQTLHELRQLKQSGPDKVYRSALAVAAPGLVDALMERNVELEEVSPEKTCELVADWMWLRLLGWSQQLQLADEHRDSLFAMVESVKTGAPLSGRSLIGLQGNSPVGN